MQKEFNHNTIKLIPFFFLILIVFYSTVSATAMPIPHSLLVVLAWLLFAWLMLKENVNC